MSRTIKHTHSRAGRRHRHGAILVGIATAAVLLTGCSGGGSTEPTTSAEASIDTEAVLRFGAARPLTSADPRVSTSLSDYAFLYFMYDRLMTYDPETGEVLPELAHAWEFDDSGTALRIELEPDLKFQDGTTLDAEAVAYSLNSYKSIGIHGDLDVVESIEVLSPTDLVLHLSRVDVSLPSVLADRAGMIVSPTAAEELGDGFATAPVGAGPYTFTSQVAGASIKLERSSEYWKGTPDLAGVDITFYADDTAMLAAARSGQLDVAVQVQPANVEVSRSIPGIRVEQNGSLSVGSMFLNTDAPPFDDQNVRLALNYAMDRDAIVAGASEGLGEPAYGPFPQSHLFGTPADAFPYDPDKARDLLKDSKYSDISATCTTVTASGLDRMAAIVAAQAKDVGVDITLDVREPAVAAEMIRSGEVPCFISTVTVAADPGAALNLLFSPDGTYNYGHNEHPELESLLATVASTIDPDARADAIQSAVDEVTALAPNVSLYLLPRFDLVSDRVLGWAPQFQGRVNYGDLVLTK